MYMSNNDISIHHEMFPLQIAVLDRQIGLNNEYAQTYHKYISE